MDKTRKTKAGRFGTVPAFFSGKQADAGITASATVVIPVATPRRKTFVERCSVVLQTLPIGSAAITITLMKKPVASAAIALTAATSLLVATQTALIVAEIALLAALTDSERVVAEGDLLYFNVIAAGTVSTQPVGLVGSVEVSVLE